MSLRVSAISAINSVMVSWRVIIVRHSTRPIGCERQSKLRALQRLTLAFLLAARDLGDDALDCLCRN
jgi:hypothetical protein